MAADPQRVVCESGVGLGAAEQLPLANVDDESFSVNEEKLTLDIPPADER